MLVFYAVYRLSLKLVAMVLRGNCQLYQDVNRILLLLLLLLLLLAMVLVLTGFCQWWLWIYGFASVAPWYRLLRVPRPKEYLLQLRPPLSTSPYSSSAWCSQSRCLLPHTSYLNDAVVSYSSIKEWFFLHFNNELCDIYVFEWTSGVSVETFEKDLILESTRFVLGAAKAGLLKEYRAYPDSDLLYNFGRRNCRCWVVWFRPSSHYKQT